MGPQSSDLEIPRKANIKSFDIDDKGRGWLTLRNEMPLKLNGQAQEKRLG
jgi:hypothetical protein